MFTGYRISQNYYGGKINKIAGIGQDNKFSSNMWHDTLYLIIKPIENKGIGLIIQAPISGKRKRKTAVALVDDIDFIASRVDVEANIQQILDEYNDYYTAIGGYIQDKKTKYYS